MSEKNGNDGLGAKCIIQKPSPTDMSLYDDLVFTDLIQQVIQNHYASKHGKGERG